MFHFVAATVVVVVVAVVLLLFFFSFYLVSVLVDIAVVLSDVSCLPVEIVDILVDIGGALVFVFVVFVDVVGALLDVVRLAVVAVPVDDMGVHIDADRLLVKVRSRSSG